MRPASLPNILTFSRILAIPFIVGFFYLPSPYSCWGSGGVFLLACFTDYLDGYVARTMHLSSRLGQLLDPLADKLLVSTTLFMLTGFGVISGVHLIPAVIVLYREILVLGLRDIVSNSGLLLPVTHTAKWKTGIQMFSLSALIYSQLDSIFLDYIGILGLWVAAFLGIVTWWEYYRLVREGVAI